jgi:SAM-dependent methyltransferase
MTRSTEILKFVDKKQLGIEVAPYFRPLLPKASGANVLVLDIFDAPKLREMAKSDPHLLNEWVADIEDVDVVGDASSIGEYVSARGLEGRVSYIVSSHNFEHLPNPIKFLQGCSSSLKDGGVLSMAVPDCRACFDHFRAPTRLVDWLQAFHSGSSQPSAETIFDFEANDSAYISDGKPTVGCDIASGDLESFILQGNLRTAYQTYLERSKKDSDYKDAHCTVMFPETLELLLRDCRQLGLVDLDILEISQTHGLEFYVHLKKIDKPNTLNDDEYWSQRQAILKKINLNIGSAPYLMRKESRSFNTLVQKTESLAKRMVRSLIGVKTFERLKHANAVRLSARRKKKV